MIDTYRLQWLSEQGAISITSIRDIGLDDADSVAYRDGMRVRLFTVASQHVYGPTLGEAIDTAIEVALVRACYAWIDKKGTHEKIK